MTSSGTESPKFLWPFTPSAFRQMSTYRWTFVWQKGLVK